MTGRHCTRPAVGRHAKPSPTVRPRGAVVLCSLAIVTFALLSPAVVARGSQVADTAKVAVDGLPMTGGSPSGLTLSLCERSVVELLTEDLDRVSIGRPDIGPSTAADVAASLGGTATVASAEVQRIHDELVGPATSDLLNVYQRDVPSLITAFAPRIANQCGSAVRH